MSSPYFFVTFALRIGLVDFFAGVVASNHHRAMESVAAIKSVNVVVQTVRGVLDELTGEARNVM